MVSTYDPSSGIYGVMMIVPFLTLILLACVVSSGITDVRPALLDGVADYTWYIFGAAAFLALVITLVGGFVSGMAAAGQPKAKKEKKSKPKKPKKSKKSDKELKQE